MLQVGAILFYTYHMVRKVTNCNDNCTPEIQVIDSISGKWTVLVVYILSKQTMRFGELQRSASGISQKVLTQTVRRLERDGIIERKVYPVVPPQVEYSLTPLGTSLVDLLSNLCVWAKEHHQEVEKAQITYDKRVKKQKDAIKVEPNLAGSPFLG